MRVYGLWISASRKVLVVDEQYGDLRFTKFPGGGLEFGEGTRDCLMRECLEEMNTRVEVLAHFYTTDFFQASAFHSGHQVMSIYYLMRPLEALQITLSDIPFGNASPGDRGPVAFRLLSIDGLKPDLFRFPIDQLIATKLHDLY